MIPPVHARRGAALVITLSILVLVTVLVLSVFLTITSERAESSASANQGDAQRLANGVVDLVKATINQATMGYESDPASGTPNTANPVAWASQPGLIRTWDTSGNPYRSYRLYSSGNVIANGALDLTAEFSELANWKAGAPPNAGSFNALWCDLNAPAPNAAGRVTYPIVTPPRDANSGSTATDTANGVPTDNPATPTQEGVQGFSVQSAPGFSSGAASAANNPAPMPVKWLYVLQDGSYISPTGSATVATVPGATRDNPIIGRVAYWTDDDTAKINVNTASEGAAWDIPRAEGIQERRMGLFQPVKNEFQRYPGHPALTSLSAAIPSFGNLPRAEWDKIYRILPRSGWPGSRAGTVQPNPTTSAIAVKSERLFATENEILFTPAVSGGARVEQPDLITANSTLQAKFFLTANSRAPETTLFETPRVSLWPLNTQTNRQDAFDRTLAFCGSLRQGTGSPFPYYFQRTDSQSSTNDYNSITRNRQLYAYLQSLTSRRMPGYTRSLSEKFGAAERDQILTSIFDYIRSGANPMSAGLITGTSAFTSGFTPGPFSANAATVQPIQIGSTRGFGRQVFLQEAALAFYCEGIQLDRDAAGNPAPGRTRYSIRPYLLLETLSPGAFWGSFQPQVSFRITGGSPQLRPGPAGGGASVTIDFPLNTDSQSASAAGNPSNFGDASSTTGGSSISPQAFLGPVIDSGSTFAKSGTGARSVVLRSSAPIHFDYPTPTNPSTNSTFNGTQVLPASPPHFFRGDNDAAANQWLTAYRTTLNPNLRFIVTQTTTPLVLEARNPTDGTVLQTIQLSFAPNGDLTLPLPFFRFDSQPLRELSTGNATRVMADSLGRGLLDVDRSNNPGNTVPTANWHSTAGDVIRGLELASAPPHFGDTRIAAARASIPSDWYAPVRSASYFNSDVLQSHSLRATYGSAATNYNPLNPGPSASSLNPTAALLVPNVRFVSVANSGFAPLPASDVRPLSAGLNGAFMRGGHPGDWDNGFGQMADGPFINMPDQGALGQLSGDGLRWSYFTSLNIGGTDSGGANDFNQFGLVYSPNRQMYSAFQLGSIPSRTVTGDGWETLLFNPVPAAGRANHRGWTDSPPDHVFADLFWMPVVDPYPISEPLSTAGKINLNSGIVPFSNIRRETGLHALLKSLEIAAFDTRTAPSIVSSESPSPLAYKGFRPSTASARTAVSQNFRYAIDRESTIRGMRERPDGFRSATQIAEVPLYPEGQGIAYAANHAPLFTWWNDQKMTGDNTREMPYAQLLPRVTTKSNTYTVHLRVQALRQVPMWRTSSADWGQWDESRDQVVSEYRGSASIERYVDPNDTNIPDFALPANYTKNLAPFYRWRTLEERQFIP